MKKPRKPDPRPDFTGYAATYRKLAAEKIKKQREETEKRVKELLERIPF